MDKVIVPDVLLQSHTASLGMTFCTGAQFPAEYRNVAFAAEHGSWNRSRRTGYKVIYLPMQNGRATATGRPSSRTTGATSSGACRLPGRVPPGGEAAGV